MRSRSACASSAASGSLGRLGGQAEPLGEQHELVVGVRALVAHLLGADRGARDHLAALTQLRLDLWPPRRRRRAARSARSSPTARPAASSVSSVATRAAIAAAACSSAATSRSACGARARSAAIRAPSRAMRCARSPRSRAARSATRRSAASSPSICARRIADAPSCGAARRCSISQAARRSSSSAAVSACDASRSARSACSRAASAATTSASARLAGAARRVLGLHGGLARGDQLLAPVALGEHALLAALWRLAHLAMASVPDAPRAVDGDAVEAGWQMLDLLDDPGVPQQPLRDREHALVAGDEARRGGARRARAGSRPRRTRCERVDDQHAAAVGAGGVEQRRGPRAPARRAPRAAGRRARRRRRARSRA